MLLFCGVSSSALAQNRPTASDGVYGRLSADTVLSAEIGGGISIASNPVSPTIAPTIAPTVSTSLRVRALDSAGIFVFYQNAFGPTRNDALGLGLDLRPLMLARIFQDWERGPRTLDLFIDSIGLELGLSVQNIGAQWGATSGLSWVFGAGAEVPLVWGASTALCLRLSARWLHSHPSDVWAATVGPNDTVSINMLLVLRTMTNVGHVGSGR